MEKEYWKFKHLSEQQSIACVPVAIIGQGVFEITKYSPEKSRLYVFQNINDFDDHYNDERGELNHKAISDYIFLNIECQESGYWKVEKGETINKATHISK